MNEKKLNLEDAFQVWWFIFWRTLLVLLGVSIVMELLMNIFEITIGDFVGMITVTISIIVQVFFIKSAINRDYKGFRLSANSVSNTIKSENE